MKTCRRDHGSGDVVHSRSPKAVGIIWSLWAVVLAPIWNESPRQGSSIGASGHAVKFAIPGISAVQMTRKQELMEMEVSFAGSLPWYFTAGIIDIQEMQLVPFFLGSLARIHFTSRLSRERELHKGVDLSSQE